MEHLLNCHGEWSVLAGALASLTTLKIYFNSWRFKKNENKNKKTTSRSSNTKIC